MCVQKEAEFREIFTDLDESGQERLLDTARALSFAAKNRNSPVQPENRGQETEERSGA